MAISFALFFLLKLVLNAGLYIIVLLHNNTKRKALYLIETKPMDQTDKSEDIDKVPNVFGSWKNLYLLVIGNLVVLIVLFYLLTLLTQ